MNRAEILNTARDCVTRDRAATHGEADPLTQNNDYARKNQAARCWKHRRSPNQNGSCGDRVMAKAQLPSSEELRQLLRYEADTGDLVWKVTNSNRAQAGAVAGCFHKATGYIVVKVNGRLYRAHRLVWEIVRGECPAEIDHIDGNRSNNRIENLRSVDRSGNNQNRGVQSNNTSGMTGVSFDKERGKWSANIQILGKKRQLGRFSTADEAAAAYAKAKADLHSSCPTVVVRKAHGVDDE